MGISANSGTLSVDALRPWVATLSNRYRLLESIGEGGMGIVYRAEDRLSQQVVALKRVITDAPIALNRTGGTFKAPVELTLLPSGIHESTDPAALTIAQEFRFLATLRHPNIISVLDFGFDEDNRPYFTMDWLPGARDIVEAAHEKSADEIIDLVVQLLRALVYLHRRNIVHRDLKPSNILVTRDGEVKVLDFGISVPRDAQHRSEGITGTVGYLAPEILSGDPASPLTDLYAVGTMVYELVTNRHPFETESTTQLLAQVMVDDPDLDPVRATPVGVTLAPLIERLMRKNPAERPESAAAALTMIAEATGRTDITETEVTRDSLLRSARFVGRSAELDRLKDAWRDVLRGNDIHFWLVGGESGVGKSRLLEELRVYALVTGALVLRGQTVSEAGTSYQLWRDTARFLALRDDLPALGQSVLRSIVTDIDRIVGHDVAPAPELEPQATQERLQRLLVSTLKRLGQPTLLLLEDLHWASDVSLALLQRIVEDLHGQPLMIVGTYRADEAPQLRDQFAEASHINLERLTHDHVRTLTDSMLGAADAERTSAMANMLHAETAGNVFYVVEALRSLASQAGGLERVHRMTVTRDMLRESLAHMVGDRLSALPPALNRLLQLASLHGRDVDLPVLHALAENDADVDRLLHTATESQLFTVLEGTYRFAHDKLRDGVLETITSRQLPLLHGRLAKSIEQLYAQSLPEHAIALAYHWKENGTNQVAEATYAAMAGQQFVERGSYKEAIAQFQRAIELSRIIGLASYEVAKLERSLGEAYFNDGQTDRAAVHLRHCVALLGRPFPTSQGGLVARFLGEIAKQLAHRALPHRVFVRSGEAADKAILAALAYESLSHIIYFDNTPLRLQYTVLRSLNCAEDAPPSTELASVYGSVCTAMGLLRLHRAAGFYDRKAAEVASAVPRQDPPTSWMLEVTGHYYAQKGDFATAFDRIERAAQMALDIGFVSRWLECMLALESAHYRLGHFDKATEYREFALEQAVKLQHGRNRARVWLAVAQWALLVGDLDKAAEMLANARGLQDRLGHTERAWMHGLETGFNILHGDFAAAHASLTIGLGMLEAQSLPVIYYTQDGYTWLAEGCLILAEQPGLGAADKQRLAEQTKLAVERLRGFAKSFPVSRARVERVLGWHAWKQGRAEAAQEHWNNVMREADTYGQVLERGLALYDMGRFLRDGRAHLGEAERIFAQLNFEQHRLWTRRESGA